MPHMPLKSQNEYFVLYHGGNTSMHWCHLPSKKYDCTFALLSNAMNVLFYFTISYIGLYLKTLLF